MKDLESQTLAETESDKRLLEEDFKTLKLDPNTAGMSKKPTSKPAEKPASTAKVPEPEHETDTSEPELFDSDASPLLAGMPAEFLEASIEESMGPMTPQVLQPPRFNPPGATAKPDSDFRGQASGSSRNMNVLYHKVEATRQQEKLDRLAKEKKSGFGSTNRRIWTTR